MKWTLLLAAGFMMSASCAIAQQPDTSQISVHYKFLHVRDTVNRDKPYTENMVLLVGKRSGIYRSNDRQVQQQISNNPDGSTTINSRGFGSPVEYYQFPNEKKLIRKEEIMSTTFLVLDTLPGMDWQITTDTATLGGMHCQKATTHFKGRDYTVWFCPNLPLHIGPWKLNGLPGVIVEAYDTKNDVRFTFDGINKTDPAIIQAPAKAIKTTNLEFTRLHETFRKDPEAFVKLISAQGGGMGHNGGISIKPGSGPVVNNPIELPETK